MDNLLPGLELLVGVLSFRSPVALQRRQVMRQLTASHSPSVALRFVMARSDPDADAGSVDVRRNRIEYYHCRPFLTQSSLNVGVEPDGRREQP